MTITLFNSFLGKAPNWYKWCIIGFLILNPILFFVLPTLGVNAGFILGWIVLLQFIFTLIFSIQCYPLQPGGLIALQYFFRAYNKLPRFLRDQIKLRGNFIIGVYGICYIFYERYPVSYLYKIIQWFRSKILLSLLFVLSAAVMSAFLDALTVTAVLISVTLGFYKIFESNLQENRITKEEFNQGKDFLVDIIMHSVVGTALGGVCTIVGEPQNLLIATKADWDFVEFFIRMAPVTMPVLFFGLLSCILLERFKLFGYGTLLPETLKNKIIQQAEEMLPKELKCKMHI